MIRKDFHIVQLFAVLLLIGCTAEKDLLPGGGPGLELTVRCDNPLLATKADPEPEPSTKNGELNFNENVISSVDFFFYPGYCDEEQGVDKLAPTENAVYHIRKEIDNTNWEYTFNLVIKKDYIPLIFSADNNFKATIYTLVNFDTSFFDALPGTSLNDFAKARLTTPFVEKETNYIQPRFPMDGMTVVTYNENSHPNVTGEIEVKRFASKITLAIHLAEYAELKHRSLDPNQDAAPSEIWKPVPHTMRLYLVDGVKTVYLSQDGEGGGKALPDPSAIDDKKTEYFSYQSEGHIRPFLNEYGISYLEDSPETVDGKDYYKTYPMYSYPREWNYNQWGYEDIDYTQGTPHEPPYLKLEMDWRRETDHGYSYDRRKYYYKVILPFTNFVRNNWYGLYLDVSILGSETDEGQAILEPTCYLLDWQNKSVAINKVAVISKARFLSVDKKKWDINNQNQLSIPFQSSHDVVIIPSSVHATRPYYGEIKENEEGRGVGDYNENLHATICGNEDDGYYLDYGLQPEGEEYDKYRPINWLIKGYTSIDLDHPLVNDFTQTDFDYSPYTITFDINHRDLAQYPTTTTYAQYVRSITITQRPGIYIEATRNSDTKIKKKGGNNPYGYDEGSAPWTNSPWGYVYMNGGRFVRLHNKPKGNNEDPFYELTDDGKREYQWQTVWYTGGSRDIYDIHVTVLPKSSDFIIGDPREDQVNNMTDSDKYPPYSYAPANPREREILEVIQSGDQYPVLLDQLPKHPYGIRIGFNQADALYGNSPRTLTWYYPTEKSSRTRDMLAPSYRIASKFGGTEYGPPFFDRLSQPYAEYRCAAYQEDGFPAGRWRVPTRAEIHFIAQLSAKEAFEFLFGSTVYWSAHGAISVDQKNGTVTTSNEQSALLRCVYDSWYWDQVDLQEGKTVEGEPRLSPPINSRDHFIWGDKER